MSQPFEIFGSQNLKDDDAQVIDDLFIETDAPPNLRDATEPIPVPVLKQPAKITRLFSGDITLDPSWDPLLILPADHNRQNIAIRVYSPTTVATDGVRFSDDKGNIRTSGKVLHGGDTIFNSHTGPVYAIASGNGTNGVASAPVSVEFWAVSE